MAMILQKSYQRLFLTH